jgi:hypothetical protein
MPQAEYLATYFLSQGIATMFSVSDQFAASLAVGKDRPDGRSRQ